MAPVVPYPWQRSSWPLVGSLTGLPGYAYTYHSSYVHVCMYVCIHVHVHEGACALPSNDNDNNTRPVQARCVVLCVEG